METILLGSCCVVNPNKAFENVKDDLSLMGEVLVDISGCNCAENELYGDHDDLGFVVSIVLRKMQSESGTEALRFLYKLCDNRNRHNR